MRARTSALSFLAALLAAGLAVGPAASRAEGRPEKEPTRLKVVLLPYFSFGVFSIAQEEGFFEEEGLEIEFVKLDRVYKGIPPLAQGQLDVLAGATSISFLNAVAKGADVRFVADKGYIASEGCRNIHLLVRKDLVESGAVAEIRDLRGRRVVFLPKAYHEYLMDRILDRGGLERDEIEGVNLPYPALLDAFRKGSIDAAVVAEPWVTRIRRAGLALPLVSAEEITPGYQRASIFYGPSLLRENPDAGRRFMAAYLRAVGQYNQGKTERNVDIMARHTGLDRELVKEVCWVPFREDGMIDVRSVLDFQDWALRKGYIDRALSAGEFWDPHFLELAGGVPGPGKP